MSLSSHRLIWLAAGGLLGILLMLAGGLLLLWNLPDWLIVDQSPRQADAIVVLGGGREGRLREAVRLYDEGYAPLLMLVGYESSDWTNQIRRHCPECALDARRHVVINGSTTTQTDAGLSLKFAREHSLQSLLVITDPYHSRRATLTFAREFSGSDIDVRVCSSGDFGGYRPPEERWWQHQKTLEYVWLEFGKTLYWEAFGAK